MSHCQTADCKQEDGTAEEEDTTTASVATQLGSVAAAGTQLDVVEEHPATAYPAPDNLVDKMSCCH